MDLSLHLAGKETTDSVYDFTARKGERWVCTSLPKKLLLCLITNSLVALVAKWKELEFGFPPRFPLQITIADRRLAAELEKN